MKKTVVWLVLLALLLSLSVSAAGGAQLGGGEISASCGETVTVRFDLRDNPGIAAWVVELRWDPEGLSVVDGSVAAAEAFSDGTILSSAKSSGVLYISWFAMRNSTADGAAFSVDFRVSDRAKAASYEITVIPSAQNTLNEREQEVTLSATGAKVTVLDPKSDIPSGSTQEEKPSAADEKKTDGQNETPAADGAEPAIADFSDVPQTHWGYVSIMELARAGIINGVGANRFAPDAPVTRAAFVKMLAGLAGVDASVYSGSRFSDVEPGQWYAPYVAWAAESGVTTGTGPDTFSPQANITRQQAATLIWRLAEKLGIRFEQTVEPVPFADEDEIAPYAAEAVAAMQNAGILTGSSGRFMPNGLTSRAAVAKMLAAVMTQAQRRSGGQEAGR